jgi:predicted anti-sigma-YlaC factor YlaD
MRIPRVGRRPGHWDSPHERARVRAAERMDAALDPAEAAWLDEHLAGCADCRAVAEAFAADQLALRGLRETTPEAPRDLWARTAAGIEQEAARRGRPLTAASTGRGLRFPVGMLGGIAVIAVVLGATAMSGGWLGGPNGLPPGPTTAIRSSQGPAVAAATPMSVHAGDVRWVATSNDGTVAYHTSVNQVCPAGDQPDCAPVDENPSHLLDLRTSPRTIINAPDQQHAIVVGSDSAGGDQVFVTTQLARQTASPSPSPATTPKATSTPKATPAPASPTATATATASASASATPSDTASDNPASATPAATPTATATPSAPASPSVEPTESASPSPSLTPEPTVASALAIASGVKVVGQSAAFSPDGDWFAFSARPADGSTGPDVYVWRVGDDAARPLTADHHTVFASWQGSRILASRPTDGATATTDVAAQTVEIDPTSGAETVLASPVWRPNVDPTGHYAIAWDGTVRTDATGLEPVPATGSLRLITWPADDATAAKGTAIAGEHQEIGDFDVRWDGSGDWVAVWTADATDPTIGRLTLFRLDRETGTLHHADGAPTDVPALPGFSIGDGRLAWATPHGQDAEGSRVQIVAWSGDGVGSVESVPGEDVVVVR